jgi:hypothetical protein
VPVLIGFALFGSELQSNVGIKKATAAECTSLREYFCDDTNRYVEVFSGDVNPATLFGNIELAIYKYGMNLEGAAYLTMYGGHLKYIASSFLKAHESHHIDVWCQTYSWGGGAGGGADGGDAAGDAVQLSRNSHDISFNYCHAHQLFDVGFTAQLYSTTLADTIYNIYFNDCVATCCGELGAAACHTTVGAECHHIYFNGCRGFNLGYGWSGTNNSVHGIGIGIKCSRPSNTHHIYIDNLLIYKFASMGVSNNEGRNVYIKNSKFIFGTGEWTEVMAAAIKFHGGAVGESDGEATGEIAGCIIERNNCIGFLNVNNTPVGDSVTLRQNIFDHNDVAEIYSMSADGEIIEENTIYTSNTCLRDDSIGNGITSCDNNKYYRDNSGTWFQLSSTEYSSLALWRAATGFDISSTDADPNPIAYVPNTSLLIPGSIRAICKPSELVITIGKH